jgi:hypothetical protein
MTQPPTMVILATGRELAEGLGADGELLHVGSGRRGTSTLDGQEMTTR